MLDFPNAKINLGLNIIEKRPDNFHTIQTVFYPIGLTDVLEIIKDPGSKSGGIRFQSSGISIPGDFSHNLCVRAYHLISRDYELPSVSVFLHKIIPIGAGLGGGSSDAAYFIKIIDKLLELNLSWGEMHHYAKQLGSDCSFFIANRPAYVEGKGDELDFIDLSLKGYFLVLVKPDIHVSTQEAYSGVKPMQAEINLLNSIQALKIEEWRGAIRNQFEDTIISRFPLIGALKNKMYDLGAVYASMSGSGSSIYGIFQKEMLDLDCFKSYFTWKGWLD